MFYKLLYCANMDASKVCTQRKKMKTIGITGQSGFIGSFLRNYLLFVEPKKFKVVEFEDSFFNKQEKLESFVKKCDVVIHLAGMARGEEAEVYNTNIELTSKLIDALEKTDSKPQVLFASSTHEKSKSGFGRAKKESRKAFATWAKRNKAQFVGLIIPHVFGPFVKPYHNSALATFCFQLTSGKKPNLLSDGELNLIYVENLVLKIIGFIDENESNDKLSISCDKGLKVSELIGTLTNYRDVYLKKNIFPNLNDEFDLNLFNTFRSYIAETDRRLFLEKHQDERGYFCEASKDQGIGGQVSYSLSKEGIERGNHFHTRRIERFCVIEGKAKIKIRKIGDKEVHSYVVSGDRPSIIDMPIWYAHSIVNMSKEPLLTLFYSNEIFDKDKPDTFMEKV